MTYIPTKQQWKNWSLPSKHTTLGLIVGVISLIITIILIFVPYNKKETIQKNGLVPLIIENFPIEIDTLTILYDKPESDPSILEFWPDARNVYQISYPRIIIKDNSFIDGKVKELIKAVVNDFEIDIDNVENSHWNGEINCSFKIKYKIYNLLGITFDILWYGAGAAHNNKSIKSLNINLVNGEIFEYKDLFRSWSRDTIDQLILEKLEKYPCPCLNNPLKWDYEEDREFTIDKESIIIVFTKYEIACGVCDPIEIKLYFNEIRNFVNPNGPLSIIQ